jgi:hypothetical protein
MLVVLAVVNVACKSPLACVVIDARQATESTYPDVLRDSVRADAVWITPVPEGVAARLSELGMEAWDNGDWAFSVWLRDPVEIAGVGGGPYMEALDAWCLDRQIACGFGASQGIYMAVPRRVMADVVKALARSEHARALAWSHEARDVLIAAGMFEGDARGR